MKTEKAILIIQNQIDYLKSPGHTYTSSWIVQTRSYIDKIFGPDSYQSEYLENFEWADTEEYSLAQKISDVNIFLEDCKKTLSDMGTYNPKVENWFSNLPNWIINLGLPALCFVSFGIGVLFTTNNNSNLRIENSKLKEELLLKTSDTISDQNYNLRNKVQEKN